MKPYPHVYTSAPKPLRQEWSRDVARIAGLDTGHPEFDGPKATGHRDVVHGRDCRLFHIDVPRRILRARFDWISLQADVDGTLDGTPALPNLSATSRERY